MNWQRYWKRNRRELIRYGIVFVAALVVGFLVVLLTSLLDKPFSSYYPHDEARGYRVEPWLWAPTPCEFSSIRTFEDEHNQ